jgi:hypothetical protein
MALAAGGYLALTGLPAIPIIQQVCRDNQSNGGCQERNLVIMECLFEEKQDDSQAKKDGRQQAPVVLFKSMPEGIKPDDHGHQDHKVFETHIINDIGTQHGQAGQDKGQDCTMNGTGQRGGNTQRIVVYPEHTPVKAQN